MADKPKPLTFTTPTSLVEACLTLRYFHPEKKGVPPAIPYRWVPGKGKLIVVTGENGGGKSLFRRIAGAVAHQSKVEPISVSMEGRRQVSYNIMLAFVYGDESIDATGVLSIQTVLEGISTCQKRKSDHTITWDEPDLGLSEGNAASVGREIAAFATKPPKHTRAVIVITHRKALVSELLAADPHYLYLGADKNAPRTLRAWVDAPPVVRPLREVVEVARARRKAIFNILRDVEKSQQEMDL